MGTPVANRAAPSAPAGADDLDETGLRRWWAQLDAQRSAGAVARRPHAALLPVDAPVSPEPAPETAQELDGK